MSYLVLARKYRPQTFEEVIGQDHVTRTLSNAIVSNRVAHAILLTGPRGTGKTTVARILAKAMNCAEGPAPQPCNRCRSCLDITSGHAADVFEIDGASNNSVDQVRELRDNLQFMPIHSRNKIFIIDEVHMLSLAAFNALLKTLEEPPPHVMFIFATTEPQKIPITILSRCQRHDLRRVGLDPLSSLLAMLCRREGFELSEESLWPIAREAGGSVRDALSLLDQVLSGSDGALTEAEITGLLGLIDRKMLFDLVEAILAGDLVRILAQLEDLYQRGQDMRKLYGDLVEHFRHLVVLQAARNPGRLVDLPEQELNLMRAQIKGQPAILIVQLLEALFQAETQVRYASQPRLTLEMIFIRLLHLRPALPIDTLIEKIDALQQGLPLTTAPARGGALVSPPPEPPAAAQGGRSGIEAGGPKPGAEAAPPASAETPPPATLYEDPQAAWEALKKEVDASRPALANTLNTCQLAPREGGGFSLAVAGNKFTVNSVRKSLNDLQSRMSALMGTTVRLHIAQTKSADQAAKRKQKKAAEALKNKALGHPLVGEVVERFQGEVVEVKLL